MTDRANTGSAQVQALSKAATLVSIVGTLAAILAGAAIAFAPGSAIANRLQMVTRAIEDSVREDLPALIETLRRFAAGDLELRAA